jgi:hypothetical protein
MAEPDTKTEWIKTYFDTWREDISRVEILLNSSDYFLEAILVLACYIGALASARFPGRGERDSYKRIVDRYSGLKSIYNRIDLLFFYQWPRSSYRRSKRIHARPYSKIKTYSEIKRHLVGQFGREEFIKHDPKRRYVTIATLLKRFNPPPSGLTRQNVAKTVKLFTVSEILYRYVRCNAVHENSFPLITTVTTVNGTKRYEDGHLITGARLLETVKNIVENLEKECLATTKFPWQLHNR